MLSLAPSYQQALAQQRADAHFAEGDVVGSQRILDDSEELIQIGPSLALGGSR
jgi:hypothetical protein